MISEIFKFVTSLIPELIALHDHVESGKDDPEAEKQLAMNIIRKAKDAQAKVEIEG